MFRTIFSWIQAHERHLSALAMVAGFITDSFFLVRVDLWETQAIFGLYTVICFIAIPLLHRIEARAARGIERPRSRALLPIATQFALGGFWSGFFVFYMRSAATSASWPFLLLIAAVLVGNEILRHYHERLVFTSVLFFFALYSYAIFAVPIYTKTIGTLTFLASGALAVALFSLFTMLLRISGRERFFAEVWRIRAGALLVFAVINISYFTNILPPLPLSAEAAGVYHLVWREPGEYLASAEREPWRVRYLGFAPTLRVVPGEPLYAYAAVFAPTKLSTTIIHRWRWYDPAEEAWRTSATVAYPIRGGRDGGYRGYSTAYAYTEGKWRVDVETSDGRLIARIPFIVKRAASTPPLETITLK